MRTLEASRQGAAQQDDLAASPDAALLNLLLVTTRNLHLGLSKLREQWGETWALELPAMLGEEL